MNAEPLLSLSVLGAGVASPVGGCWQQTAASVRVGISRYQLLDLDTDDGEPVTVGRTHETYLPALPADLNVASERAKRCLQLAAVALRDLVETTQCSEQPPLLLALPEPLPEAAPIGPELVPELAKASGLSFDETNSNVYQYGRAGGLAALHGAFDLVENGAVEQVIVGGVDSAVDPQTVQALAASDRILRANQAAGLVPGEAAAFVLFGRHGSGAQVFRPAFAQQQDDGHDSALGQALVEAYNNATPGLIRSLYAAVNGEESQQSTWVDALQQLGKIVSPHDFRLVHAHLMMGDVGAAFGPLLIGLAAADCELDPSCGPALISTASDASHRAAVAVTA